MAGLALLALSLALPRAWSITDAGGLQAALIEAKPGDTVRLAPGTYRGHFVAPTPGLTLEGAGATLDGEGRGTVLLVTAAGVTVRGLRVVGSGASPDGDDAGIKLVGAEGCRVVACRLEGVFHGLYLARSSRCHLADNTLTGQAPEITRGIWGDGIHAWNSAANTYSGNQIAGFRDGMYLEFAPRSVLSGNDAHHNRRYGLHFMFMDDSRYQGNRFHHNLVGSVLMYSRRITIADNAFSDNRGPVGDGVLFKENVDSVMTGNRIVNNSVGLFMDGSNRNRIEGNLVAGNGWGLLLYSSSIDNLLRSNDWIANGYDLAVDMPTSRNTLTDNYWSRYRGYDLDGDGHGDVPYAPVGMFSFLAMQYPDLFAFALSPAVQALAWAQRLIPGLSPSALRDPRPRMTPARLGHGPR